MDTTISRWGGCSHPTKPMLTVWFVVLVPIFTTAVMGCTDVTNGVVPKNSFHAKFGWKAESFFNDPQVIALCKAIEANDLAEIDRLVASGVNVNARGEGNMTPLFWAFPDNQLPRFQRMLDHGADPNVVVTTDLNAAGAISVGDSVTHLCARTHFPGYFEAVMRSGGDPNLKDGKGHPVIQAIVMTGVPDAANRISLAIDNGADINAYGRAGATPVFDAISWFGQYDLALLLLERGADPTIYQKDQLQNAIHLVLIEERQSDLRSEAERAGLARVKKWLQDHGYDLVTAKSDIDRWAKWGQMAPGDFARLRKAELKRRMEAEAQNEVQQP